MFKKWDNLLTYEEFYRIYLHKYLYDLWQIEYYINVNVECTLIHYKLSSKIRRVLYMKLFVLYKIT